MQYYIKFINTTTNELVGYYKETGKNRLSKLKKGIKYFDNLEDALQIAEEYDDAFLRDIDKHYYKAYTVVYGDHTREALKTPYKSKLEKESELEDELKAFIRKNSSRDRQQPGD